MPELACAHPEVPDPPRMCAHLLGKDAPSHHLRFTGRGVEHVLVCDACRDAPIASLTRVCPACFEDVSGYVLSAESIVGAPEVRRRTTALRFEHRTVAVPALTGTGLRALAPLPDPSRSLWLGVTDGSVLARVDVDAAAVEPVLVLGAELDGSIGVVASPCARFAAIVERKGRRGVVVDLAAGTTTMILDRGDYHEDVCEHSVAFFQDGTRTLLVHATDWNRLDISDPATGALLTARDTDWREGAPRPERYLDYFHAGLTISPGGRWLVDDGWVWHPVGVLRALDLARWTHDDVWESEVGKSVVSLRDAAYFWDGPRCFVAEDILAAGGFGPDDEIMVDAAVLYDVAAGKVLRWFAGPPRHGAFVFDSWLFASAEGHGTSVWDVLTGELVCLDPSLVPAGYHPGARRFVTDLGGGTLRSSALVGA